MAKKSGNKNRISPSVEALQNGINIIHSHPLFGRISYYFRTRDFENSDKQGSAYVTSDGYIMFNKNKRHTPQEWAYIIAHLLLHLGLGHTNPDKVSKAVDIRLWNIACDIYIR